ncbi:unnamed protein product [Mytilus coruscus]|uniref:EGF-like domain-containing protein n=1 Tax=Mytilus coruscus TaxID=42192 RepID=A0A6J8DHX4_MYTCO|nr:unnamed protein product [Mytilus coruscus]
MDVKTQVWVRRKDGICENNCCDNKCSGITCKNRGSCKDGHCSCTPGFSGDQCQNYDPCHNVSCMKGGYCVSGVCYCQHNNQWGICEHDPCYNVSCIKGGYCVSGVCYCQHNNQWLQCEHCYPNQCSGHGKCINLRTGFSCTCDTGYTGLTCHTDCHPDPCNRNGHCTNSPSGFSCTCQTGYTGSTCNKNCHPDPCSAIGTCLNSPAGYMCHCNKGYTGKQCNTDCSPDPCNGNGACHSTQSGFTCSCHQGYTGQTCSTQHHCNKFGLLMDLAAGKALHQQGAKGCGGNSSDAVLIKHCQAPLFSRWQKGLQVISHCSQLNTYTPLAEWDSNRFTDNIGVMTSCQNGVIENHVGIWVDVTAGHCGSQDCCHCASNLCLHGLCSNNVTDYTCACDAGYTGYDCDIHVSIQTTTDKSTQALLTSTYRSTQALLTTTERSTQPLLTTTHRSTQVILTATAKLCMDDQLFNCQNPDICKSKFRDNCPLSCGICETTQSSTERGAVQHTCNKFGLLMDLAIGKALHQQSTKDCGGNSSDAVVIKHCQAPSFSKWRKGFEVTSNCSHINHYTPVAEWNSQGFTDNIGVMTFCHSGVIEMMSQTCGGQMVLKNITSPASKSFYTVDWA